MRLIVLAGSLLLGLPLNAQVSTPSDYAKESAAASQAFGAGQFDTAIRSARAALAYVDWDGGLWLTLARAERQKGNMTQALDAYRHAVTRGIGGGLRSYDLLAEMASLFAATGATDSAVRYTKSALGSRAPRARMLQDSVLRALSKTASGAVLAQPVNKSTDRVAGWRSDLDWLLAETRRMHSSPSRVGASELFASEVAALKNRISSLSDMDVALEIQRLVALLGDGHTIVYPLPTPRVHFGSVPIDMYRFADGVYVIRGDGAASAFVGARVDRVAGLGVEDALRRVRPFISHDNAMAYDLLGAYYLALPAMLRHVGGNATDSSAVYDITMPDGSHRSVSLKSTGPRRIATLSRSPDAFSIRRVPKSSVVYAQVNQVGNTANETLRQFAMRMRDTLSAAEATTLVLDLRNNNGGNNFLNAPIVQVVSWFELNRPNNLVVTLTSRVTFSAAQNLVNALDRYTGTLFAGEPSGSKPNFNGEDNATVLPWSGVTVSLANRYWADSYPEDTRQWVAPDLPYKLRAADYFAGRDPLLDAVVEFAMRRTSR